LPAIITPPDIERRPRRSDENDGGHGRRPPNGRDLKRTGGGGDNDSNNESSQPQRRPGARLAAYRLGLACALGGVSMFFVGIVSLFFHSQSGGGHIDAYSHYVNNWVPTSVPPILWLNTAVLLLSSVTIEIARRHMFHEIDAMEEWFGLGKPISRLALPWLLATLALGLVFLTGQMVAWHQLAVMGSPFRSESTSSHSFYIITYAHAFHLTAGVLALMGAITGLYAFKTIENRQIMVDSVAWYWHSMGALWLFLFVLLICCQ
jgi:cytochrome c oxidase subunit 3